MSFTRTIATEHFPMCPASWAWIFWKTAERLRLADFDHDGRQEVFLEKPQRPAVATAEERHGGLCRRRSLSDFVE